MKNNPTISQLRKAAPDMYEALKEVIDFFGYNPSIEEGEEEFVKLVRKALAKAEGRES